LRWSEIERAQIDPSGAWARRFIVVTVVTRNGRVIKVEGVGCRRGGKDESANETTGVGQVVVEINNRVVNGEPTPFSEWSSLTSAQHDEVWALARRGKPHPDPAIRRTAQQWAQMILKTRGPKANRIEPVYMGLFDRAAAVVCKVLDVLGTIELVPGPAERRWARRVLAANPPE
jgi:hypothetical protein